MVPPINDGTIVINDYIRPKVVYNSSPKGERRQQRSFFFYNARSLERTMIRREIVLARSGGFSNIVVARSGGFRADWCMSSVSSLRWLC